MPVYFMKTYFRYRNPMIKIISILLLVFLVSSCFTKKGLLKPETVVLPLGDTIKITDGSLVYALPLTVFDITVELERVIEKPGPYAKYAADMLGIKDVITHDSESWSIVSVRLNANEELDPSEFYVIESNTLVQTNALALKKSGLIMDISTSMYEKESNISKDLSGQEAKIQFRDMGADEYFIAQSDTAYRKVKLDTAFIKIPYLVEKKKQLTIDQLAEKAAKTLLELRDGKHLILTGEANVFPQDGAAIDEMNRLEREYTALFAGKTLTARKTLTYSFIPQKDMSGKPVTIFKFSELTGVSDATAKEGSPVTVTLESAKKTKDVTIVTRPKVEGESLKSFDKLYYRIPDVVTITVKSDDKTYYNARKLVYQYGPVIQLPANFIIGK
jgi:hypothetical protein